MTTATVVTTEPRKNLLERKETSDLETLLKACEETRTTWGLVQNDIVFIVTFWAMIESGFEALDVRPVKDKSKFTLPENWKHQTRQIYEAQFVLPPYVDNKVKLLALPAEDILCLNVLASNISPRNFSLRSLAIHTTGHVSRPEETTLKYKFSSFNDFHVLVRNAVIWPMRCSILTDQGVLNASLRGLSDEIKLKIIRHLTVKEILILGQTCHDLNRICNDQGLWKAIYHEEYKEKCKCHVETDTCGESFDWKQLYKETRQKELLNESDDEGYSPPTHSPPEFDFGSDFE